MFSHKKLRDDFSKFFEETNHKLVPAIPLVPQNDPTTLFTGSGMQQLVPYLLGEIHPLGKRLYNIQPCFRSQDILEIGDNRHTTFFEMMGNWSLGDYFKKEQLRWFWQFLTEVLGFDKKRLYVTVFAGDQKNNLAPDEESKKIWLDLGVEESHIFSYGPEKNWWSRAGVPDNMPEGEPGGPDSEVFYDFGEGLKLHENSSFKDHKCHPNCDCGRFMEIGNSVFMQFKKTSSGFQELPSKNVDFGGGLERILAALNNNPDVFLTDVYLPIIKSLEKTLFKSYEKEDDKRKMRVIADHLKGAVFLIKTGVYPSNKERGYYLRRLLRRITVKTYQLKGKTVEAKDLFAAVEEIVNIYQGIYFESKDLDEIKNVVKDEIDRFNKTLNKGLQILSKIEKPDGKQVFDLYQSYGFPKELTEELLKEKGLNFDQKQFDQEFEKHRQLSRTASAGMFKGGLADHSEKTLRYHTATHLLHQALFDVLGENVRQEGSHITGERLRFDFFSSIKPGDSDIQRIEAIINEKINQGLNVNFVLMPKNEAYKIGAKSFFREKYPDTVKVYYIGESIDNAYSKEFCGGPHVKNTKEIGKIKIYKFEKIGANIYRIYAK
ncbi:MAG: alanine--tRNA ligase [Patescibacteria group bacterium]|nr:MAG: alanine--tRNA ligase [Patescibacteria group bacterium]